MKKIIPFIVIALLLSTVSIKIYSQTLSNLERINLLVDISTQNISSVINDSEIIFNIENKTPTEYSILNDRVISGLSKEGIKITNDFSSSNTIDFVISHAGVEYTDLFRDGLFGEYLLERRFDLTGNYVVNNEGMVLKADTFEITKTDTISYNNLAFIENSSLPFTKASVPSEPFAPSILEPVIAITAVAVTIVLFFTVRSK
ncbi:MAG: hypothetical protein ABFS12_08120 [Bacteroidota bacterium]